MALETVQNDSWKLEVAPGTGASIAGLYIKLDDDWHPILRETPSEALETNNPSKFSSFVLAPYSNRLKNAEFSFQGETHELRATTDDGNTQHGDVRGRPWQRLHLDDLTLEFMLTSKAFDDFNFPFPFTVSVTYRLEGNTFETSLRLTNVGDKEMPAGFGLHPYFKRSVAGSDEVELGFSAAAHYLLDEGSIPTGNVERPAGDSDFSSPRAVGEQQLNDLYRGWSDPVTLTWPGVARLELRADPVFEHLIVFTHADGSLAVEPVTNANDGFNLYADGESGSGVVVLAPGEALSGSVQFILAESQ